MRLFSCCPLRGLFQRDIHPAKLLEKEFAGPGRAFVACENIGYLTQTVQNVNHECLAAGRDHCWARNIRWLDKSVGVFHRLGFGYGCQIDEIAESPAGGGNSVEGIQVKRLKSGNQGLSEVSFVGMM